MCSAASHFHGRAEEGTLSAQGAVCIMNVQACPQPAKRENKTRTIEKESVEVKFLPVLI